MIYKEFKLFKILALKDLFPDLIGLSLVFEYMPHTLYSRLKDESNPLCRQDVRNLTKMLLKGLKYLHHMDIMHRVIIKHISNMAK